MTQITATPGASRQLRCSPRSVVRTIVHVIPAVLALGVVTELIDDGGR